MSSRDWDKGTVPNLDINQILGVLGENGCNKGAATTNRCGYQDSRIWTRALHTQIHGIGGKGGFGLAHGGVGQIAPSLVLRALVKEAHIQRLRELGLTNTRL